MTEPTIITERYNGKTLSLSITEWSKLLNVPKKTLYGRRKQGKRGAGFVCRKYTPKSELEEMSMKDLYLAQCYRDFNFSHGIINLWRQKNGIR